MFISELNIKITNKTRWPIFYNNNYKFIFSLIFRFFVLQYVRHFEFFFIWLMVQGLYIRSLFRFIFVAFALLFCLYFIFFRFFVFKFHYIFYVLIFLQWSLFFFFQEEFEWITTNCCLRTKFIQSSQNDPRKNSPFKSKLARLLHTRVWMLPPACLTVSPIQVEALSSFARFFFYFLLNSALSIIFFFKNCGQWRWLSLTEILFFDFEHFHAFRLHSTCATQLSKFHVF